MLKFFLLHWNISDSQKCETAEKLINDTLSDVCDWQVALRRPGLVVFCELSHASKAISLNHCDGIILGTLFRKAAYTTGDIIITSLGASEANAIHSTEGQALTDEFWGNYVSILYYKNKLLIGRDCTGQALCFTTSYKDVFVAFSHMDALPFAEHINKEINWNCIISYLQRNLSPYSETGLLGVKELAAGEYIEIDNENNEERSRIRSWKPETFINAPIDTIDEAKDLLRDTILYCTKSYSLSYNNIILLLSGGLDSSILLASLQRNKYFEQLIAFHLSSTAGDVTELHFAEAIASRYDVTLVTDETKQGSIEGVIDRPQSLYPLPTSYGVDKSNEEYKLLRIARSHGITGIFSGRGGDQIFFKRPEIAGIYDYALRYGWGLKYLNIALDSSRLTKQSLWRVIQLAEKNKNSTPVLESQQKNEFLSRNVIKDDEKVDIYNSHPWFSSGELFPYGKHSQLQQFLGFGSFRSREHEQDHEIDHVHPFIAQPLMETVLRIPSFFLLYNGRKRGLAREVFRYDLPLEIYHREDKAYAGKFAYNQIINNLSFFRRYLLDGYLISAGILDKELLEKSLNENAVKLELVGGKILGILRLEKWLRNIKANRRYVTSE